MKQSRVVDEADEAVAGFVREITDALVRRDGHAYAALWGGASLILSDRFEIVPRSADELEVTLFRAWDVYEFLNVARIVPCVLDRSRLTSSIVWVRLRFSFFDGDGVHLTDGDAEYTLRFDDDRLRCYCAVNLTAESNIVALAHDRGFRPSYHVVCDAAGSDIAGSLAAAP